ncbi:MAG: hypothetical protein OXC55_07695 [Chloroflexi bacterium]|nr:hypothetical protein [Chloroflexota bacterium]
MKGTAAILRSHIGVGSLRILVPVLLVLAATGAFLFAASPVAAGPIEEIVDLNLPIKVEETRDPPVRVQRQVQGQGASITSTSNTLVSNIGQPPPHSPDPGYVPMSVNRAQSFTTGTDATTLTRVDMDMRVTQGQQVSFVVEVWTGNSVPTTKLADLGGRNSLGGWKTEEFAASGDGIALAPNTKYWVVIDLTKGSSAAHVRTTRVDEEDQGATAGWSIGDEHRFWSASSTWEPHSKPYPLKIRVEGYVRLPANFDCNAHLGWEHTNGRRWDSVDRVWRQVGSYYFTGQYANTREPICELRFSSSGAGSYAEKLGYGLTLCSVAPTWQTVDPATGEAVGGPDTKHYTGHKTSSGQDICSDFDGLRSTKKYIQEQQLKQLCSREPTNALCK